MNKLPSPKSTRLTTWSKDHSRFCFGLKKSDAEYIAEQAKEIKQDCVIVWSGTFPIRTECNITETFTTTCTHLGNARIAEFIEEHGKGVYGAAIEVDRKAIVVNIVNKIKED